MRKNKVLENTLLGFLVVNFILAIISSIRNFILHYEGAFPPLFCDHTVIYNECRMTIERINIAEVAERSSTWPWSRILGIFVHGAFFDLTTSQIYACVLYTVVIVIACIVICKTIESNQKIVKASIVLAFLSSWYYVYLVCAFNNGSLVCILIFIALALLDERPIWAGIIMAFAMVKAQIAFPFFVIFLFRKKWKTIFTSVSIVVGAWILYCVWIWSSPIEQLKHLLFGKTAIGDKPFLRYGMFDFILLFDNTKSLIALILSIVVGLVLLVFVELKFIPIEIKNNYKYLSYFPPAICCLLWFYTTKCDYLILTIIALGLLEWWIKSQRGVKETLFLLCGFCCTIMNPTNILAQLLAQIGTIDISFAQPLEGRFDTVMLLIMLVVLGIMARKKYFTIND